jgi:hypothetical protein
MSDLERWEESNEQYLSAALAWLRLRLERLAAPAPSPVIAPTSGGMAPPPEPARTAGMWSFLRPSPATAPAQPLALPAAPESAMAAINDEQIAAAAEAMAAAAESEPPPALLLLTQRFGLSRFEREALLLCVAMELDTRIARLCALAQGDLNRPYPTFALALSLFDEPAWDALSPERPLRHWRLLEINQPGAQPLTTSALRADERIVSYVKGLNYLDDRLSPLLAPLDGAEPDAELPLSQQEVADSILAELQQAARGQRVPLVQLLGPDAPSKQRVARRVAGALGLHLYRLPAGLLPAQAAEIEVLARLWQRESVLLPLALYVDGAESEGAGEGQPSPLHRFLSRVNGLLFLDTREVWPGRPGAAFDVAKPTAAEQRSAWAEALDEDSGDTPALLAGQFNLSLEAIDRIARSADSGDTEARRDALWNACLAGTRPRLDALAQRLDPRATWDDIVLPEPELRTLRQIADQVGRRGTVYEEWGFRRKMNRGLGISALFAGESGTGKTMAAEVIANELRLNIYRIDLSAVVSKYIGETEKNLRRLFDAAEDGGAILFFDEADAIFGKRSEVKDSHDRYANIEINYLLQRMESYGGLAILATNMKSALDTAFLRRLRFIVSFPYPGPGERRAIWQRAFPAETPLAELDFDRLSRFNFTGGHIHNIALNAAFLAARAGTPVTMPLVLDAARSELRKLEKPINEADFKWAEPVPA